ncbi:hypothetical protein [Shouchella rhizosphaerae]|uniref:hypothetical protein n=1 Tax=Shouchella rhizosphaerae TaxID=866786 RepID=UPI00092103BD|nr:hypothetical protein [Shouchella rhizosphaerae]SHL62063.1 hypothetical protein SAMN05192535_2860 [Shouchella rhizosphaerae]
MGETHAVTPAYFPLFARLSTLPANATVSLAILTRQLKQLVPLQYQWYQAQLRTQAIQTDTSQVVTIPGYMFTDQEVAAINTYLENNPPNEERLNENPIVTGVVDFFFGDFLTLADPEASLGEKALATTFILVKPAKVGEVIYDLSKARKVKTGGKGAGRIPKQTVKSNKGKTIDVTPTANHSTTTSVPNPAKGTPNSSVDITDKNTGEIKTRRFYGPDGRAVRDVDYTNHGNAKTHPEWPHEHIFKWNSDGTFNR